MYTWRKIVRVVAGAVGGACAATGAILYVGGNPEFKRIAIIALAFACANTWVAWDNNLPFHAALNKVVILYGIGAIVVILAVLLGHLL